MMRKGIGLRGDIFEPSATLFLALGAGKLYSRLASVFLKLWALDFSWSPMRPSFEESPGR